MGQSTPRRRPARRGVLLVAGAVALSVAAGGIWWEQARANDSTTQHSATAQKQSRTVEAAQTPAPASPAPAPSAPAAETPAAAAPPAAPAAETATTPDQTPVAPVDVVQLPPVALTDKADFGNKVTARVASATRVQGEGHGMGERSGPSVLVTLEVTNGSAADITLDFVVVNLYSSDGSPGQTLWGDSRSKPLSGNLAPGASATGVFVLRLPDSQAPTVTAPGVTVTFSYGADTPTAVFSGNVAA